MFFADIHDATRLDRAQPKAAANLALIKTHVAVRIGDATVLLENKSQRWPEPWSLATTWIATVRWSSMRIFHGFYSIRESRVPLAPPVEFCETTIALAEPVAPETILSKM
jgi:hypothetical protein